MLVIARRKANEEKRKLTVTYPFFGEDWDGTGPERGSAGLICEGWPSGAAVIGLPSMI